MIPLSSVTVHLAVLVSSSLFVFCHVLAMERVSELPGFDGELPFELYTGYITLNETSENNLFYYFFKSDGNAEEDPLILWLAGGPGCSGLRAIVFETGPIRFKWEKYSGIGAPAMEHHPYALTKVASVIFVDAPTFAGYSYSGDVSDHNTGNTKHTEEDYIFMKKWLEENPEFQSNPLYIGGDSSSGMIIPAVTYRIAEAIESQTETIFNLKGYFAGNPCTDDCFDACTVPYSHRMGLIPDDLFKVTKRSCHDDYYSTPKNENCTKNLDHINEIIGRVNPRNILETYCGIYWSPRQRPTIAPRRDAYELEPMQNNFSHPSPPIDCREYTYYLNYVWANQDTVMEALHVRKHKVTEWPRCTQTITYNREWTSVVHYHRALISKGYRALIYSGDHDLTTPYIGTSRWLASLNLTVVDPWRPWGVENQVAGFTRKYAPNVTFATVKGAGHTAPEYKPKECYYMFKRWLANKSL